MWQDEDWDCIHTSGLTKIFFLRLNYALLTIKWFSLEWPLIAFGCSILVALPIPLHCVRTANAWSKMGFSCICQKTLSVLMLKKKKRSLVPFVFSFMSLSYICLQNSLQWYARNTYTRDCFLLGIDTWFPSWSNSSLLCWFHILLYVWSLSYIRAALT